MILNNYYLLRAAIDNTRMPTPSEQEFAMPTGMTAIDGTTGLTLYTATNDMRFNTDNWALRTFLSMRVGIGTTEPVGTDYRLQSDMESYIVDRVVNVNVAESDGKLVTTITMTARSTAHIIITEVGVTKGIVYTYGYTYPKKEVLLIRELLENPIDVPANQGFSLSFVWEEV